MVKLAKFQSKAKFFAGFLIPYSPFGKSASGKELFGKSASGKQKKTLEKKYVKTQNVRVAMLGGGDIGFTLLFSGVMFAKYGLISLIIPFFASIGLLLLLLFGNKNKFYPAMPFLGASCFVGYGLILLI